jgi:Zn-dependent peptidase ImmA (M78 family)
VEIEHLSREYIDAKVEKVFTHFFPDFRKRPIPPSVCDIALALQRGDKIPSRIPFSFDCDLGIAPNGKKILGRFDFATRAVLVDPSLAYDSSRFRWTLSHEIGHLVLHRHLARDKIKISDAPAIVDTRTALRFGKKARSSEREWIEWQANEFAAAMILPRIQLYRELLRYQEKELHLGRRGFIYVDDQPENRNLYYQTIAHLAQFFTTSRIVLHRRLHDLRLLQDNRPENRARIGYLMKSLLDTE